MSWGLNYLSNLNICFIISFVFVNKGSFNLIFVQIIMNFKLVEVKLMFFFIMVRSMQDI